jgi:hypothetical protein
MASRPKHPNKEIEAAVCYAEEEGWTWFKVKGHAWDKLYCPHHDRDGCTILSGLHPGFPSITRGR